MLNVNNINDGRIIFMGTSYFSVLSIENLLKYKYNVLGVVTTTDRFSVRNKKLFVESAIKKYSRLHALPILQSDDLKNYLFLETLQKWHTEICIIVAFRMLPKIVWNIPIFGSFNLHPSLLPNYRGAAPIHWVIMNGDTKTGISIFRVDEKIDTGRMLLQKKISIEMAENAGSLSIRLSEIGAYLIVNTIKCIFYNCIAPKEQTTNFNLAPKLLRVDTKINWKATLKEIYNKIRGLSPFPGSLSILEENMFKKKEFKIYRAYYSFEHHPKNIGTVEENKIFIKEGYLLILECQLEGKLKPFWQKQIRRDSLVG
ncbi:methionyl-tRNA formyltransferase [Candidatus Uzinura diaspidicola str. ASNER]|uniref:Methionyl-tRNA formyltransferase n=1 Tax=Candidatus Uzinura diaspidicola str. ASNER TaxID=1133592 RepID=L7VMQ0_9FLAO|nr:methionyl-tRNA formyltransferase [Candidatus Uzinura diaspidicola str. ASNER]